MENALPGGGLNAPNIFVNLWAGSKCVIETSRSNRPLNLVDACMTKYPFSSRRPGSPINDFQTLAYT